MPFRLSTAATVISAGCGPSRWNGGGETQWLAYFGDILAAFERIVAFPQSGRARDAFAPGMRSVRCREHVIFYLPGVGTAVVAQRLAHGARNAEALDWSERNGG